MTSAVIVAAGQGKRMGPNVDKLFLKLDGCPVVGHTWRRFETAACIDTLVLVIRPEMRPTFVELAQKLRVKKSFSLVDGGKERQDSVWNGLAAVPSGTSLVAIHDAARPCTPEQAIAATLEAANQTGAAVAAQPITDTVKESADGILALRTMDRSRLWTVQTPQCFRIEVIRRALGEARNRGLLLTDDTAACELIGQPVQLVHCAQPNPKVTRPEDLPLIEALLGRSPLAPPPP